MFSLPLNKVAMNKEWFRRLKRSLLLLLSSPTTFFWQRRSFRQKRAVFPFTAHQLSRSVIRDEQANYQYYHIEQHIVIFFLPVFNFAEVIMNNGRRYHNEC